MTDSASEVSPKLIMYSNRPDIQKRVENHEAQIEDEAPSSDKFKTREDLVRLNREARNKTAAEIRLEREKERKYKDKVTGLKNRLWLDEKTIEMMKRADENGKPLYAVLYDIDKFKDFNSMFGHPGGDSILRLLKRTFTHSENVGRYGGEEIVQLIDPSEIKTAIEMTDEDKIEALANRARSKMRLLSRKTIADLEPVQGVEGNLPHEVTFSFGVTRYQPGESASEFMKRASEGVLHAKNQGRNRGYIADNSNNVLQFKQLIAA